MLKQLFSSGAKPIVQWRDLIDRSAVVLPSDMGIFSKWDQTEISELHWKLSSRNRVTPVFIQDGVKHGITFAASLLIAAALMPILAAIAVLRLLMRCLEIVQAPMPIVA